MKLLLISLFSLAVISEANAQTGALKEIVNAENEFVAMAKNQNRRDAFLFYLSDSAIISGPNGPVKGKERIKAQPVRNDWLFWEVAYSDVSSSGDFGFNTGPWEFRPNKTDPKPAAWGTFNSVWIKQSDGSWKNVLDIGIGHGEPPAKEPWHSTTIPLKKRKTTGERIALLSLERNFLSELAAGRKAAYEKYLSAEARITYSGQLPFTNNESRQQYVNDFPTPDNYKIIGGELSPASDMGYAYGSADVDVSSNGKSEVKKASYTRIWKLEGSSWKIVLEVVSF